MTPLEKARGLATAIAMAALAGCTDGATAPAPNPASDADARTTASQDASGDRYGGDVDVLSNQEVRRRTGKTIAEWGARWWKWAYDNPQVLGDVDGTYAALGNVGGPVFFAEGSGGDPFRASVTVPGGQYILLPVATYLWTFFDPCAEFACAQQIVNHNFIDGITSVSVTIDGERVRNLRAHLVRVEDGSAPFTVDAGPIGEDGYGGILPAVQGGYWLMLAPLRAGEHRVSYSATVPTLDGATGEVLEGSTQLDADLRLRARRGGRDR
jgi:hypothetical protein